MIAVMIEFPYAPPFLYSFGRKRSSLVGTTHHILTHISFILFDFFILSNCKSQRKL